MGFIGTHLPDGSVWALPIPQDHLLRSPSRLHLKFATAHRLRSRLILQRRGHSDITLCDMEPRYYSSAERTGLCALDLYFDASDLPSAPALKAQKSAFDIVGYSYESR